MSRRRRSYYLRSVYLMLLLATLAMGWASAGQFNDGRQTIAYRAQQQALMGREFFSIFAFFSVISIMLIAPILTCTAIGGERLHKTFHVLLMTPISAGQIVSGKLFSRMLAALTLVGLSLPALAVVRLLGGVEISDLLGLLGLVCATGLFAASLGLLYSCWITRAWAVILMSYLTQAFLCLGVPLLVMMASAIIGFSRLQSLFSSLTFLMVWPNPVFATAMNIFPGAPVGKDWISPIVTHLVMASLLLIWAAAVVRRLARREGGEASLPAAETVAPIDHAPVLGDPAHPPIVAYESRRSVRAVVSSRPVGDFPIFWYEMRQALFRARSWKWISAMAVIGFLMVTYLGFAAMGSGTRSPLSEPDLQIGYAFVFGSLVTLVVCVLAGTVIANEKESDTWTLLIASPVSGRQIILGKLAGVWRRSAPLLALMAIHFLLFTVTNILPLWVAPMLMLVTVAMNMLFVSTGIYLSLTCRKATTAVVVNLLVMLFAWVGLPILVGVAWEIARNWIGDYQTTQTTIGWFIQDWLYPLHPAYYYGEAIDRCRRNYVSYNAYQGSTVADPWHWPVWIFGKAAIQASVVYLGLSGLILIRAIRRFDRIVGRAETTGN